MVWKLGDLCLQCVLQNTASYPEFGHKLPTVYKELLIERLSNHDGYIGKDLKHLTKNLFTQTLRRISFHCCAQVTDKLLQILGQSGCKLETLMLKRLENVTDVGVQALTKGQDQLRVLHIKYLPNITHKSLLSINSPHLWSFKLVFPQTVAKGWLISSTLSTFLSQNPSIRELEMSLCNEHIPTVAQGLAGGLEELKTNFQSVADDSIEALAMHCPNLRKIDLNGAKFVGKEALIKLFQACTQMSSLDLGYCSRLSKSPESEVLWTLPQSLCSLSLCGLMLTDGEILVECLTRLPRISQLKLCGVPALSNDTLHRIVEKIGGQIVELNLSGIGPQEITDEGLTSVSKYCTNLESLHISLLRQVTGTSLRPIFSDSARAAKIKSLSANSKIIDMSTLDQMMSSCPNLDMLDVSGVHDVTDAMVISLADHSPNLTQLNLKGCKLVTDAAICHLSGCCPLTSLCLSGLHSLTDKSIFCLASSCPQMEEVFLNGCANISPVAVQYFKDQCLGRLYAKHNIPNASPNQLMAKNLDTGEYCRADLL